MASLYRQELLDRFYALTRPPRQQNAPAQWNTGREGRWKRDGWKRDRFAPPRPASERAKAVGMGGLDPQTARAVLAGLLRHPEIIAGHAETIAKLPLAEPDSLRLRDALLDFAMEYSSLDQEQLNTILAAKGAAALAGELRLEQGLGFSFNRRDVDTERATRDLVLVVETLARRPELDAALDAATDRLKEGWDEAAFVEQQSLRSARDEANRKLAALIEGDADI